MYTYHTTGERRLDSASLYTETGYTSFRTQGATITDVVELRQFVSSVYADGSFSDSFGATSSENSNGTVFTKFTTNTNSGEYGVSFQGGETQADSHSTTTNSYTSTVTDALTVATSSSETYAGSSYVTDTSARTINQYTGTTDSAGRPTTTLQTVTVTAPSLATASVERTTFFAVSTTVHDDNQEMFTVVEPAFGEMILHLRTDLVNTADAMTVLFDSAVTQVILSNAISASSREYLVVGVGFDVSWTDLGATDDDLSYQVTTTLTDELTATDLVFTIDQIPAKTSTYTYHPVAFTSATLPSPMKQVGFSDSVTGVGHTTVAEGRTATVTTTATRDTFIDVGSGFVNTTTAVGTLTTTWSFTSLVVPTYFTFSHSSSNRITGITATISTFASGVAGESHTDTYYIATLVQEITVEMTALFPSHPRGLKMPFAMERTDDAATNISGLASVFYPFFSSVELGALVPVPFAFTTYRDGTYSYTARWHEETALSITRRGSSGSGDTTSYSGVIVAEGAVSQLYGEAIGTFAQTIGGWQPVLSRSELAFPPVNAFNVTSYDAGDTDSTFFQAGETFEAGGDFMIVYEKKRAFTVATRQLDSRSGSMDDGNYFTDSAFKTDILRYFVSGDTNI